MKKEKWNRKHVSLFIVSLLTGFLLIVQTQTVNGQHLYVPAKTISDYEVTIEGERQEVEKLKERLKETKEQMALYEKAAAEEWKLKQEIEQKLREDSELYAMAGGCVAVMGNGVTVTIDDGTRDLEFWEEPNDVLVHDLDLLMVVCELKAAGAEAIAVNGQRIVDVSSISCAGHTVRINGTTSARPFKIQAIGDGARMSAALVGPGGVGSYLADYVLFKVEVEDNLVIPAYTDVRAYENLSSVTAETGEGEGEKN